MSEGKTLWLAVLTLYLLAQAVVGLVKIIRNRKANGNPGYGARLTALETEMENFQKNNDEHHSLIRRDIEKLFKLLERREK